MTQDKKVTVYTTPTCGFCKQAKEYLTEHNIAYIEVDVSADAQAAEEMVRLSGQMSVPVIEIDGEIVVGFDQKKIVSLLEIAS